MSDTDKHIEIWTESLIPLPYFEKMLEASCKKNGIKLVIAKKWESDYTGDSNKRAFFSIRILSTYFVDFISKNNAQLLLISLRESFNFFFELPGSVKANKTYIWEDLYPVKFEIVYSATDKVLLHFDFLFSNNNITEEKAWKEMCSMINKYELKKRPFYQLVNRTLAQKDQQRYFSFELDTGKWDILNPINEVTMNLSKDYMSAVNDLRIRKPIVLINEERYKDYFVWDQQWVLDFIDVKLIMARPNDIALYLSLCEKNVLKAKSVYENELKSHRSAFGMTMLKEKETTDFYDYFEYIIAAITFSYTAIETLANICIVDNYEYVTEIKGVKTIYSKEAIERNFKLREKLKVILKEILKTSDPVKEKWWNNFILLEDIRNEIIHTKQGKSESRYSLFLDKKIFDWIKVSRIIVEYYGKYIDKNLRLLLIDFPYGFGYDNTRPNLMTNEDYLDQWNKLHNPYKKRI